MLAVSVSAANPAPQPLPEFITEANAATLAQAGKELRAAQGNERNLVKLLDTYAGFTFSPELRPKLKDIFGAERPFPMQRSNGAKGQIHYDGKLAPHLWVQGNGTDFSWAELNARISTEKTGRSMNAAATWPSLVIARQEGSVALQGMSMTSKQLRGADGVGYGTASFGIATITVRDAGVGGKEAKELMRFEDMDARSAATRRGNFADISYRSSVKAIVFGAERVERANFAFRLTNLPAKTMVELDQLMRDQEVSELAPEAQRALMLRKMKDFGKRVAMAGATLHIDDISAAYRGNTASVKGRLTFQKLVETDFDNVASLMKKLVARFEVRVPVALIKDIGSAFASKSVDPNAPDAARQIESGADGLVSVVVGKAVSGGYAVVEKNELRSTIEFKGGKLTVNGKALDLSKVNVGGKAPAQETK